MRELGNLGEKLREKEKEWRERKLLTVWFRVSGNSGNISLIPSNVLEIARIASSGIARIVKITVLILKKYHFLLFKFTLLYTSKKKLLTYKQLKIKFIIKCYYSFTCLLFHPCCLPPPPLFLLPSSIFPSLILF